MRGSVLLIVMAIGGLSVGCAALDPLGSPQLQPRDPEAGYSGDFPVQSGIICRDLTGQATVRDISGTAQGIRCLQVGDGPLPGCLKWGGDGAGYSYQSEGCLKPPVNPDLTGEMETLKSQIEDVDRGLTSGINEVLHELGAK